jgi:hypothetical protein
MNGRIRIGGNGHVHCCFQAAAGLRLFRPAGHFIRELISRTKQQLAAIDVDYDRAGFGLFHEGRKRVSKIRQRQIGRDVLAVNTGKHDRYFRNRLGL